MEDAAHSYPNQVGKSYATMPSSPGKKFPFFPLKIVILFVCLFGILLIFQLFFPRLTRQSYDSKTNGTLTAQPTSTVSSDPTATPTYFPLQKENVKAVTDDLKLSYFYETADKNTISLKRVDFKTNVVKETQLPKVPYDSDPNRGRFAHYKVSPDQQYVVRITQKKLEIARLTDAPLVFTTVYTVPPLYDPSRTDDLDYAYMGDAAWDGRNTFYFLVDAGLDGRGPAPDGYYSELFKAQHDGSSVVKISDHTQKDENYGINRTFTYFDAATNRMYMSGSTHGGHFATMIAVDGNTGKVVRTFSEMGSTVPVFTTDYSKAFFTSDYEEEGYDDGYITKLFSFDMTSGAKKLLFETPFDPKNYSGATLEMWTGNLHLDTATNRLFYQVRDDQGLHFYTINADGTEQPKLLFTDTTCQREGVSQTARYLLLVCSKNYAGEYQIYDMVTKKRFVFLKFDTRNDPIEIIDFN
jgi:hypothetical protein